MKHLIDYNLSVFGELEKINPDLKLFSVWTGENLDAYYNIMYGVRVASPILENMTSSQIAQYINSLYANKWDTLLDYTAALYSTLVGGGSSYTETRTTNDASTIKTTNTNNVSAYNDDDFSPNEQEITNTENGGSITEQIEHIDKSLSNIDYDKYTQYLMTNYIYDTVFSDINNICTLKIMEVL